MKTTTPSRPCFAKRASEWVLRRRMCLPVGRGYKYPGSNLLLPHPAIIHTTTLGVAVGPWKLHYGEPPVNMQVLHSLVDTKMGC
jgi:hypothetical protein